MLDFRDLITSMKNYLDILYRINEQDRIIFVNDAWNQFALENNSPEQTSEHVLNRSLWDFITDATTIGFYSLILRQARSGRSMEFNLRCDTDELRRFLVMAVSLLENGEVQFLSRLVRVEKRNSQKILRNDVRRKKDVVIICSWCGRIHVEKNDWQEIEEAVRTLGLFELDALPQISHGMCGNCYQKMSQKL